MKGNHGPLASATIDDREFIDLLREVIGLDPLYGKPRAREIHAVTLPDEALAIGAHVSDEALPDVMKLISWFGERRA